MTRLCWRSAPFCGGVGCWLVLVFTVIGVAQEPPGGVLRPRGGDWPPVLGAWFWNDETLETNGYKTFLDAVAEHSPYTVLSTSVRVSKGEIVEPRILERLGEAVRYAGTRGLKIAVDLDLRLARRAFRARYPEEQQEELVLKFAELSPEGTAEVRFSGEDLSDHMTGRTVPYQCLATRLVRVYSFVRGPSGIEPATVTEVAAAFTRTVADGPAKLTVTVTAGPAEAGRSVCVIGAHTYLTPDVFAPHLLEFQREILRQHADLPLAGVMKDEWGFPPDHSGNPAHDRYWYSVNLARAYEDRSGGRDFVRDVLLMAANEQGRERERQAAVNRYGALCRERNAQVEDDFYRMGKALFGPQSAVLVHATWTPYPGVQEFRKNGLDWWDATRDIGQTDESTPYPCRTSLAKRWGYPLWYNQFYASEPGAYLAQPWPGALAGGRLNVHPLYPRPRGASGDAHLELLRGGLMDAMVRLRMLDYITQSPLDCPVAVVFGHACAMNWAGPGYNRVGLDIAADLCGMGYPTDLIPSSLVASSALRNDATGYIALGPQRYRAVVIYQPEFEDVAVLDFFSNAAAGKTALFMVGDWTRNAEARPLDAMAQLGEARVRRCQDESACVRDVVKLLAEAGVERQSPWAVSKSGGHFDAVPPSSGHSRLVDGTYVRVAGTGNPAGDPIRETLRCQGREVVVDAIGLVAVRFGAEGQVAAFAAGGLKRLETGRLAITLPQPVDLAFRTESDGKIRGVIQGWVGPIPETLLSITREWQRLAVPPPLSP